MGKDGCSVRFKFIEPFKEKLLGDWRCLSYDKIADKLSFEGTYVSVSTLKEWYKLNGGKPDAPKSVRKKRTRYINPYINDSIPVGRELFNQQFRGKPMRTNL
jgi:hypothetical protein